MHKKVSLVFTLFSISFFIGCSVSRLEVDSNKSFSIPQKRVIVFFIDGLRYDVFYKLSSEGKLPNITKYIINRGCNIEHAITCIPSITYAVTASMQTGKFPGHHHITGNRWFDRFTGKYQDYTFIRTYQQIDTDLKAITIFQALYDKFTVTIQTACRKGATRPIDNWASSGINWFFGLIEGVDELIAERFELIEQCSLMTGHWPDYIFAYFPATDEIGHRYGADSKQYIHTVIHADKQIGRICELLTKNHLLDNTYLILISDHGHVPAKKDKFWDPAKYFRQKLNIPIIDSMFLENKTSCERLEYLKKYELVIVNGGYRRVALHIKTQKDWFHQPSYDEIVQIFKSHSFANFASELLKIPAIELIAIRDGNNRVQIFTHSGRGVITRRIINGEKMYRYTSEGNALNYPATLTNGSLHTSREWLRLTCTEKYPDFVPQIVEFFDSPRAGDVVIFAAKGWDFSPLDFGGHGSVIYEDMHVPFIVAGPNIPHKAIKTARVVDLAPTVLDLLGCEDRIKLLSPLDGKSIVPDLLNR